MDRKIVFMSKIQFKLFWKAYREYSKTYRRFDQIKRSWQFDKRCFEAMVEALKQGDWGVALSDQDCSFLIYGWPMNVGSRLVVEE